MMKSRKSKVIVKLVAASIFLFSVGLLFDKPLTQASTDIELTVTAPDSIYLLGEIIPSNIKILNKSSKVIYLSDDVVESMSIQISSTKTGGYKYYCGPGRGWVVDGHLQDIEIQPKSVFLKPVPILWNFKPDISHLSESGAKGILEGRILTHYAFTKSGIYFIKGVLTIPKGERTVKIESEPVQITIKDPQSDDLEVWNEIKDSHEFAHFLQQGDLTRGYHNPDERTKFQAKVEQLLLDHPNSFYTEQLRRSLDIFKIRETARREAEQRMQLQKTQ